MLEINERNLVDSELKPRKRQKSKFCRNRTRIGVRKKLERKRERNCTTISICKSSLRFKMSLTTFLVLKCAVLNIKQCLKHVFYCKIVSRKVSY